ncbi:hypothetical protein ACRRTK_023327 [Alexandromys fortis]
MHRETYFLSSVRTSGLLSREWQLHVNREALGFENTMPPSACIPKEKPASPQR